VRQIPALTLTSGRTNGKSSPTISRKPDGIAAASQVGIKRADNFWVAAAEREDAGRFIVQADEKLTAFQELERAICLRLLTEQI